MSVVIGVLVAILIFGLIIFIHEFGHFTAAKLCGVKVDQFAIGMGPAIFKKQKGETLYALRLLPFGGFCSMEGENEESDSDRAFCNKKVWQRIIIVAAGAFMNLVLGFIVVVIMISVQDDITSTQISWFEDNAVSHSSGLMLGDEIKSINGYHIFSEIDMSYQLQSDEDGVFDFVVERDGKKVELNDVEFSKKDKVLHIDFKVLPIDVNPLTVCEYSAKTCVSYARLVLVSLKDLVLGKYKINDLSGPVGIVDVMSGVVGDYVEDSGIDWYRLIQQLLSLAALITINVGIFNLLPLPALDGGRLVFLIIEGIRRKPVPAKYEGYVHATGLALLMALMVYITAHDIFKLFG